MTCAGVMWLPVMMMLMVVVFLACLMPCQHAPDYTYGKTKSGSWVRSQHTVHHSPYHLSLLLIHL